MITKLLFVDDDDDILDGYRMIFKTMSRISIPTLEVDPNTKEGHDNSSQDELFKKIEPYFSSNQSDSLKIIDREKKTGIPIKLFIVDLYLGPDNGVDLIDKIYRQTTPISVFLLTGTNMSIEEMLPKHQYPWAKNIQILRKPIALSKLKEIIFEAVKKQSITRS